MTVIVKAKEESLEQQVEDLRWHADQIYRDVDQIDRQDMSIADWLMVLAALKWSYCESLFYYPDLETSGIKPTEQPPVIGGFDSRKNDDFLCSCAGLQEKATTLRKRIRSLPNAGDLEAGKWEEYASTFEHFRNSVENTLSFLFVEDEPSEFEVGTLIIKKGDDDYPDWVGVTPPLNADHCPPT